MAVAYAIGGVGTPRALLILELGQSVLGGLLAWGVMRLAREAAPQCPIMAAVAGLIAAVHPTLVYAATHVQVAGLGATLLVWALTWGYRTGVTGRPRDAAITGVLLGVLALTDPILSMAMVGIGWAIWMGRRGRERRPSRVVAADLGDDPRRHCGHLAVAGAQRPGPRRVRGDQEHIRLRVLAGELQAERGDGQGSSRVHRADLAARSRGDEPERVEPGSVGGAPRGGIPGRHRPDEVGLSPARRGLGAGTVAHPVPSVPWRSLPPTPGDIRGSACGGSGTSSSSTRRTPRRGCWSIGRRTSG